MNNEIEKKTWEEFRESGLLFITNKILHIFGYALVYEFDDKVNITQVYPARVKYRGFDERVDEEGFRKISKYMKDNAEELEKEANE